MSPEDGREFRADKLPGSFRVFVVGESSAAGTPYPPRYAFSAWLRKLLEAALPDRHVEVVNAALSGYASRRLLPVVREITGYSPDLVIVYMGHNESAERQYYAHLIDMDPRLFRLWQWAVDTRLYRVLSPLFRRGERTSEGAQTLYKDANENSLEMFAVLQERAGGASYPTARDLAYRDLLYEFNLNAMADVVQAAGAQIVLLTLSQNFSDWPPGASTHRADLSDSDLRRFEELDESGRRARERGDCRAAQEAFSQAQTIDADFAALHFERASCHRAQGERASAREEYRRASDLDRVPHGAPTYFNDVIRRVARAHSAPVDVEAVLEAESGAGLVGDDLFLDWVHPNLRAHQRIARAIAEELRRDGIPVAADRWREPWAELPEPEAVLAADPILRVREEEMRMFACTLARRAECVRASAESLLRLDPGHVEARAALAHW
ncbi:MAG TPA: SGNH/GDSL hydrolase family protein [Myxococcota bacterium]|nr:SGNH/GDSL hydrolase family protein [Myxococcota bacterium]